MNDGLRGLRVTASMALMNKILKSPKTRKSPSPKRASQRAPSARRGSAARSRKIGSAKRG